MSSPDLHPTGVSPAPPRRRPRWKRWAKRILLCFLILVLAVVGGVAGLAWKYHRVVSARPGGLTPPVEPGPLGRWVNPFIGTGGFPWVCGHNFPGVMAPLGLVRLGPETASIMTGSRALNTSGYFYGDERVLGFSHTRLNGTGAVDGGHFLVSPALTAFRPAKDGSARSTRFSHHEEVASPGYYAVRLPELNTLVELTATPHVGVHRYTFPAGHAPHLYLDVANALGGRRSAEAQVRIHAETGAMEGSVRTFGTFAGRYGGLKAYFAARLDPPVASFTTWQDGQARPGQQEASGQRLGVDASFPAAGTNVITLRLAVSHVSAENARLNLAAEASGRSFEDVVRDAQQAWEEKLALVRLEGGTDAQRTVFYTALFRVFQMPTLFQDVNGEYLGFDRQVHRAEGFRYYTDLSLWDTFRTVHPLLNLLAPADQRDMVWSLMRMLEQGGWLPRWPSGNGYSNSMLGTPADIVLAEAYLKGLRDFDAERAYQAMRQTALAPTPRGAPFAGREGVDDYVKFGYAPAGRQPKSVSRTLEFGWADHALASLAEALGHREDAALFRSHAQSYRHLWNANTQYFQPRDAAGKFVEPFKPLLLTYLDSGGRYTRDYVEGSALQWRWAVPYDAEGLASLFRSRDAFVTELNQFFAKADPAMGAWNPGSYYWHGNEPDIHAAYLFNTAGRPDLTRKWVRWILENKYGTGYDGLDGNDDAGTLSAWYVFSALGLYPIAGTDRYELGAPLFPRAEIKLPGGRLTVIRGAGGDTNIAARVRFGGQPWPRTWIRHADLVGGGELVWPEF